MKNFIKNYALEIYTLISLALLLAGGLMDNLSVIQKFVLVYTLLFILHEWEEARYPGGFADLISKMIRAHIPEIEKRGSRIYAGILLLLFTYVPFFLDDCVIFVLATASLGIFEGIVHALGIRLFRCKRPYTPGMVTAELELIVSIALIVYLNNHNLASGVDYAIGAVIMIASYIMLQKCMTLIAGVKYSEIPKRVKAQWRGENN